MNFRLKIEPKGFLGDLSGGRLFSIAVVDLDRSKSYPLNFVCMLPVNIGTKAGNAFQTIFRDGSIEQAKALLTAALESEDDPRVKAEIGRRLKLLAPEPPTIVKCSGCGKPFNRGWVRKFRRKFCPECMAKKYGSRN
jgi:hypothetical protein